MVSGSSSSCRGGGQLGHGKHGEKYEAVKRLSDRGHIRGSCKYTNRGLLPPPAFNRRESSFYAHHIADASTSSGPAHASTSRAPPPPVKMEVEADWVPVEFRVVPGFALSDYVKDADLDKVLTQLQENASMITAGDYVNEHHFPIVVGLLVDKSRHEADKAEEWRQVEKEQAALYVDLGSDEE